MGTYQSAVTWHDSWRKLEPRERGTRSREKCWWRSKAKAEIPISFDSGVKGKQVLPKVARPNNARSSTRTTMSSSLGRHGGDDDTTTSNACTSCKQMRRFRSIKTRWKVRIRSGRFLLNFQSIRNSLRNSRISADRSSKIA